jgi:hypothetical protein
MVNFEMGIANLARHRGKIVDCGSRIWPGLKHRTPVK